jgi:hypothetical protein
MGKFSKAVLIANFCLWAYFWIGFAHASQPYDPRPWGHPPVEPYSFGGRAVGLTTSIYSYAFMKITFWAEIPSFASVTVLMRIFFGRLRSDRFVGSVSVPGYKLLAVMLLSFLQWYFVGWLGQILWQRWTGGPRASRTNAPSD